MSAGRVDVVGLRQKSGSKVRLTIELKQGILANSTTCWPSRYVVDFARSPAQKSG
jgi:hypothetical protein